MKSKITIDGEPGKAVLTGCGFELEAVTEPTGVTMTLRWDTEKGHFEQCQVYGLELISSRINSEPSSFLRTIAHVCTVMADQVDG